MKTYKHILIGIVIGLIPLMLSAQVFTQVNEIAAPISATGSSNIASIGSVWAQFSNPAGLSRLKAIELAGGLYKPYGLSYFSNQLAVAALPLGRLGTIALGYQGSSTTYSGNSLASETAVSLSHGFFLQKDIISTLSIGYTLNLYQLDYGQSAGVSGDGSDGIDLGSGFGFGLDLGIQGSLHERTWVGLYVKNINSPEMGSALSAQRLPRSLAIGLGYEPYYGLTTTFMVYQKIGTEKTQYRVGLEYRVMPWLVLRTGVNTEPNRLGFGFGLEKWGVMVDYAFISHPLLPETHQFSLGYTFRKDEK
ncbi:MAG: hypothetical protein M0R34_04510 [Candidatus Marinimicrobia bacterium]|nr:hypothetical protein [Candidatus Neomarinimicrobiota bacterium]MDD5540150.1 hypothetical protein [Candidatus Neomarinimicrobiota bacterium]